MPDADHWIKLFFEIDTFIILTFMILVSFGMNWHLNVEIISLVIILCGYVLLLILPIKRFKLGPTGFEGDLDRLTREPTPPVSREQLEEVDEQVERFSENTVEPDLIFMRLSIEIETTLRAISEKAGLEHPKASMLELSRFLQDRGLITDSWFIDALRFLRMHRNELVHEGKTTDVQKAIDIGRSVLAKLREIQQNQ